MVLVMRYDKVLCRKLSVVVASLVLIASSVVAGSGGSVAEGATTRVALGSGVGTAQALAQPNCDKTTRRIKVQYYATAPCVKGWSASSSNGGATAQGVTASEIHVVVLVGDQAKDLAPTNGGIKDYALGTNGLETNAVNDSNAIYARFFQTWGRKVVFDFQKATGTDEAAQRADAIVALGQKPFAILCMACQVAGAGGGATFSAAVAGAGVPANPTPATPQQMQAPSEQFLAEFLAKSLDGKPAKYAGDTALTTHKRKFGVLYDTSPAGLDISVFKKAFTKYGGKASDLDIVPFTVPNDPTQVANAAQEQAPTLVAKLQSDGDTTVVPFTNPTAMTVALTKAATSQNYFPEWAVGPGQDLDFYARSYDPKQWAHAFGNIWYPPWIDDLSDPLLSLFQWYWGKNQGTYSPGADALLRTLYNGIMVAGPKLTAATYDAALNAFPPAGGAYNNMVASLEVNLAQPRGLAPRWATGLGFWSPTTQGPSQIINIPGTGKYLYLDGAKRYLPGNFPKGDPGFFTTTGAIATFPTLPTSDHSPTYPCTNCPSTGSNQTPSHA
jgi:hypothetical protein